MKKAMGGMSGGKKIPGFSGKLGKKTGGKGKAVGPCKG